MSDSGCVVPRIRASWSVDGSCKDVVRVLRSRELEYGDWIWGDYLNAICFEREPEAVGLRKVSECLEGCEGEVNFEAGDVEMRKEVSQCIRRGRRSRW